MDRLDAIAALKRILQKLERHVDGQYCRGHVWYEDDLVSLTASYLREEVQLLDGTWMIGTNHPLRGQKPDLTCYFSPSIEMPDDFYDSREDYIVGLLEFKFANQGDDLKKLAGLQQEFTAPVLAWRVFGDHFSEEIHRANGHRHEALAGDAERWAEELPNCRGATILRCGHHQDWESSTESRTREVINRFWIRSTR